MYWISQFGMTVKPRICVSFVPSQGLRQSSDAHSRALAHAVSEQKAEKPGEQSQLRLAVFGSLEEPGWFGRWIRRDWWIASHRFTTCFLVVIVEGGKRVTKFFCDFFRVWCEFYPLFTNVNQWVGKLGKKLIIWATERWRNSNSKRQKSVRHSWRFVFLFKCSRWMGLRWPAHEPRNVTIDFVCGGVAFVLPYLIPTRSMVFDSPKNQDVGRWKLSARFSGEGLVAAQSSNALALGLCEAFSVSDLAGEADKGEGWSLHGREYC